MLTAGHCAATAIEILCVFALFHRFDSVGGWTFGEAAVFYALVNIMFARRHAEPWLRGVRHRLRAHRRLRPRAAAAARGRPAARRPRSAAVATGTLLQASVVLVFATSLAPIAWDASTVAIAMWAMAGGVALFFGILVLQATSPSGPSTASRS